MEYLVFEEVENELVLETIKPYKVATYIHKNKLHVKGSKEDLFTILFELSNEIEIELM